MALKNSRCYFLRPHHCKPMSRRRPPGNNFSTRETIFGRRLVRLFHDRPPEGFWAALIDTLHMCDDTWWSKPFCSISCEARKHDPAVGMAGADLPLLLPSASQGSVADNGPYSGGGVARRHRGISVPDPVVAETIVEREFAPSNSSTTSLVHSSSPSTPSLISPESVSIA